MSKANSTGRVQTRAFAASDTLADKRARTDVDWIALRAENARRVLAAGFSPEMIRAHNITSAA